jgi:hypothetical protein
MNITFENKLFHGKIEDSESDSIIPTDNNLFRNPSVLSGKLTELRQKSDQLQEVVYSKALELERQIINWNLMYPNLLIQLEEYERHINDQLFLRSDSEGFFKVIGDNFTNSQKIDQILSNQVIFDEQLNTVSLDHSEGLSSLSLPAGAYSVNMYMAPGSGMDRITPVYGSSLSNLFANSLSSWTGQVITQESRQVSVILEIVFPESREIGEVALSMVDSSLSGVIDVVGIDDTNTASILVEKQAITNTNTILVNKKVKRINIQITKNAYDEKYEPSSYRYIFHIKRLALKSLAEGYKTEGFFKSIAENVNASKFALEVCDFEDDQTSIHYFLTAKNATSTYEVNCLNGGNLPKVFFNITNLNLLDAGDESGQYANIPDSIQISTNEGGASVNQILVYPGNQLGGESPDNDLYVRVLEVDGEGKVLDYDIVNGAYSIGKVAEITPLNKPPGPAPYIFSIKENNITNNYISPRPLDDSRESSDILTSLGIYNFLQEYNYHYVNQGVSPTVNSLDSINLFANHISKNSPEEILEEKDGYYVTWVYVDSQNKGQLNVGNSGIIFEGLTPSNQVFSFTKTGWYKVRIPITSYLDVGNDFLDNENLRNLDTKYPYNGKYLIEGTNLNLDPYKGFKVRAKKKFTRCNTLANLGKENFYLLLNSSNFYIVVLHNEVDMKDAYLEFPKQAGEFTSERKVSLIAKFKTANNAKTPILGSYKIKLGE